MTDSPSRSVKELLVGANLSEIFRRGLRVRGGDGWGVAAGRGFSRCIRNRTRPQRRGMRHMQVWVWAGHYCECEEV
jgi:hypothetical protein